MNGRRQNNETPIYPSCLIWANPNSAWNPIFLILTKLGLAVLGIGTMFPAGLGLTSAQPSLTRLTALVVVALRPLERGHRFKPVQKHSVCNCTFTSFSLVVVLCGTSGPTGLLKKEKRLNLTNRNNIKRLNWHLSKSCKIIIILKSYQTSNLLITSF